MAGITAEAIEASSTQYEVVVWLYHESGNLWEPRTATPGTTLTKILDGEYGSANHWVDVCTGYEWPKDRPIS
jgi:hypothetical protein